MNPIHASKLGTALACLSLTCAAGAPPPPSSSGMLGFTSSGVTQQQQLERRFDSLLSASEMRDWLKQMSSEPNHVGSPHDKANAEWMLAQFKKWGWEIGRAHV